MISKGKIGAILLLALNILVMLSLAGYASSGAPRASTRHHFYSAGRNPALSRCPSGLVRGKASLAKESHSVQTYHKQASAEELTKQTEETSKESEVKGEEASKESEAKAEEASKESEGKAEGESEGEGEAEKPWWQFKGWEAVFTVLGCILYAIVLQVLPRFISKGGAEAH